MIKQHFNFDLIEHHLFIYPPAVSFPTRIILELEYRDRSIFDLQFRNNPCTSFSKIMPSQFYQFQNVKLCLEIYDTFTYIPTICS